ncbi:hypothetical protein [Candidatus Poriferisocius sp.]|uniref:hypothetical protein n=1 Tax=Candidatus Poriferisocius sp. TaxID=3101276 RepID=UPI003B025FFA
MTTPHHPDPMTSTEGTASTPSTTEARKDRPLSFWKLWAFGTAMIMPITFAHSLVEGWIKYLVVFIGMLVVAIAYVVWQYWRIKE